MSKVQRRLYVDLDEQGTDGDEVDFTAWLQTLPRRFRQIAKTLAVGETTSNVARKFRMSPGRVSQVRRELKQSWEAFRGEPALA